MIEKVNKFALFLKKINKEYICDTEEELKEIINHHKNFGLTENDYEIKIKEIETEIAGKGEKKYIVFDLNKDLFSDDAIVFAKNSLEAGRKYIKFLGENGKVSRNLDNHGRLVIRGSRGSYLYNVD